MWSLYTITNLVNGKQYIGIATDPKRRWIEHRCQHGSKIVYQAIQKYGLASLKFEVLYTGTESDIKQREVTLIKKYNTKAPAGYNLTDGGEGTSGLIPSQATRDKMRKSATGARNGMYGKQHSKETRERMRQKALKRQNRPTGESMARKGAANGCAKPVLVDSCRYGCIKDAARVLGCHPETLRRKFRKYRMTSRWPVGWSEL